MTPPQHGHVIKRRPLLCNKPLRNLIIEISEHFVRCRGCIEVEIDNKSFRLETILDGVWGHR